MSEDNTMELIPEQQTTGRTTKPTTDDSKKWSDLETRQLITLYEENEILWNVTLTDYRNRAKKNEALRGISMKLKTDVTEVQRKLHNLRSQFNSELKKLKKKSSGQSTDEVYVSNWPYFTALKFINVKTPTTCSTLAMKEKKKNICETVGECEDEDNAQPSVTFTEVQEETVAEIQATPVRKKQKPSPDIPPYVQQAIRQLNQANDEEQVFGDFCASELRQIKNPANKRMFKKIVMEAITNIGEAEDLGLVYTPYNRPLDVNYTVTSTEGSRYSGSSRSASERSSPFQVGLPLRYHEQPTMQQAYPVQRGSSDHQREMTGDHNEQQQQILPLDKPSDGPTLLQLSGCKDITYEVFH